MKDRLKRFAAEFVDVFCIELAGLLVLFSAALMFMIIYFVGGYNTFCIIFLAFAVVILYKIGWFLGSFIIYLMESFKTAMEIWRNSKDENSSDEDSV